MFALQNDGGWGENWSLVDEKIPVVRKKDGFCYGLMKIVLVKLVELGVSQ